MHEPVLEIGAEDRAGFINAFVAVANVKGLFAEFSARGVPFDQRLQTEAWGGRDFIVRDPDGNAICFSESES